jgi:hypothetical protein
MKKKAAPARTSPMPAKRIQEDALPPVVPSSMGSAVAPMTGISVLADEVGDGVMVGGTGVSVDGSGVKVAVRVGGDSWVGLVLETLDGDGWAGWVAVLVGVGLAPGVQTGLGVGSQVGPGVGVTWLMGGGEARGTLPV